MATVHQLPSGRWRAQIRRKGFQPVGRTFDTESEAKRWGDTTEANLVHRVADALARSESSEMTLSDAYELYTQSPAFSNKAETTRTRERQASDAVLRLLGKQALVHIDYRVLQRQYFDIRSGEKGIRTKKPLCGDTLRLERALLSSIFSFAVKRGYCETNPVKQASFDFTRPRRREHRITPEQQLSLYEAAVRYVMHRRANVCLANWLWFIFATGTRPGEAAKVRCDWVDIKKRTIQIPRASHKNRQPRIIVVAEKHISTLTGQLNYAQHEGSEYLFFSTSRITGKKTPYQYSSQWRKIVDLAGLPRDLVAHSTRHEYISRLFENTTLSDSQIALLVGDVHVLSLEPYKHLRANALRGHLDDYHERFDELMKQAQKEMYNRSE